MPGWQQPPGAGRGAGHSLAQPREGPALPAPGMGTLFSALRLEASLVLHRSPPGNSSRRRARWLVWPCSVGAPGEGPPVPAGPQDRAGAGTSPEQRPWAPGGGRCRRVAGPEALGVRTRVALRPSLSGDGWAVGQLRVSRAEGACWDPCPSHPVPRDGLRTLAGVHSRRREGVCFMWGPAGVSACRHRGSAVRSEQHRKEAQYFAHLRSHFLGAGFQNSLGRSLETPRST